VRIQPRGRGGKLRAGDAIDKVPAADGAGPLHAREDVVSVFPRAIGRFQQFAARKTRAAEEPFDAVCRAQGDGKCGIGLLRGA